MRQRRLVDARMILCASPVYHPYRPEWHHWWSMLKSESGGGNELIWFWFNWVWLFINEKNTGTMFVRVICDEYTHCILFVLKNFGLLFCLEVIYFVCLKFLPCFWKLFFFPQWLHWKMVALGRWVKGSCLLFFQYYNWKVPDG